MLNLSARFSLRHSISANEQRLVKTIRLNVKYQKRSLLALSAFLFSDAFPQNKSILYDTNLHLGTDA